MQNGTSIGYTQYKNAAMKLEVETKIQITKSKFAQMATDQ